MGGSVKLTMKQFERIVERAIARIPAEIREHLQNLAISIEEGPEPELLEELGLPADETLFGLYTGVPLPERSAVEPPLYPDVILIFRGPLMQSCESIEMLEEEIEITVAHEVAHYLGMSEEELDRLGYS